MTDDIKLPPLPKASKMYDIPGYDEEELKAYAREAVRLNAHAEPVNQHPDDAAVDAFAAAMKAKLAKKRSEGRGGWQECSAEYLSDLLRSHVEKGDPVDVANLAMMLHQNGQRITPAEPVKVPSNDLAHEIWAAAQLAPGEGIVDGVARVEALLLKTPHPAITHCDNCGCDWLDNGLNPIGCPYCKQSADAKILVAERDALEAENERLRAAEQDAALGQGQGGSDDA